MDQKNFTDPYEQPFIQQMLSTPSLEEKRYQRGMFLTKLMIGFSILFSIFCFIFTGNFIVCLLQIGLHLLLYRGFRWVRILLGLSYGYNVLVFYAFYKFIVVLTNLMIGLIVLPFLLCNILAVFFLFFNESINHFLESQRDLYR